MEKTDMMIIEQIKAMLEEKELQYQADDEDGIVAVGFPKFNCLYHVREDSLDFRLLINKEVPEEYTGEMLKLLNHINGITKDGHWELIDNHIYYRLYTNRVHNKEVSDKRIAEIFGKGGVAAELFYTGMEMVCEGIVSGEDAFEKLIMKRLMEE